MLQKISSYDEAKLVVDSLPMVKMTENIPGTRKLYFSEKLRDYIADFISSFTKDQKEYELNYVNYIGSVMKFLDEKVNGNSNTVYSFWDADITTAVVVLITWKGNVCTYEACQGPRNPEHVEIATDGSLSVLIQ
jgi:hypothetical protein